MKKYYYLLPLLVLTIIYLIQCTTNSRYGIMIEKIDLIPETISLLPGVASSLTWYPESELKVYYDQARGPFIKYFVVGQDEMIIIPLLSNQVCDAVTYAIPTPLLDGRLGLIQECKGRWPDNPQIYRDARYMVAYNWQSNNLQQIIARPLSNRLMTTSFSWNPEMTRGVQQINGSVGTIWWITPDGPEPMDITIGTGNKGWSLAENLRILETSDIDIYLNDRNVGNANFPAWSPDGRTIAFFASTEAFGKGGINRMVSEYQLYLMDPILQQPYPVLDNLYEPFVLSWSPNSQWLAFTTEWGGIGDEYVYIGLFSTAQNLLYLFSPPPNSKFLQDLVWSPSGMELAVLSQTPPLNNEVFGEFEVGIYDISGLVIQEP